MILVILTILILVVYLLRPFVNRKREQLIYQMTNDITSVLHTKTYADFGTLLGAYRDNGVIKDDMDGDLAIIDQDQDTCYNLLQSNLDKKYSLTRDSLKLKVWLKGTSIGCDIGIYNLDKDNDILTRQTFVIPYNKVFPLKTISWGSKNIPINIPNDPEWYLRYQYGETWKISRPGDKGKEGIDQGNWNYSFLYGNMYKFIATLAGLPLLLK
jgi:hypothetical protein